MGDSDPTSSWTETTRRTFLRGLAGTAISLPLMPSLGASEKAAEYPTRFIVFFSPNGTIQDEFFPEESGSTFTLGRILEPLKRHKDDLLIFDGLDMKSVKKGPGDGHQKGMGHMLTGTEYLDGPWNGAGWSSGMSIDQGIAKAIGDNTDFQSLEFGVQSSGLGHRDDSDGVDNWGRMSYAGPDQPLAPENNPMRMYERIFGNPEELKNRELMKRRNARGRSVLDAATEQIKNLKKRVGCEDREKLDSHLSSVRSIEERLDDKSEQLASCSPSEVEPPQKVDDKNHYMDENNYPEIGKLQMDILVTALKCQVTNVASIQWENSVGGTNFPWVGVDHPHHHLSHLTDDHPKQDQIEWLTKINRWYATQLAYLIDELKAVPEGDGTLFDNTCILWCNELSKGHKHSHDRMPFVLAGSAGGYFDTGQVVDLDGRAHNDLLVSLMNAYGVKTEEFGDPDFCSGPVGGIT